MAQLPCSASARSGLQLRDGTPVRWRYVPSRCQRFHQHAEGLPDELWQQLVDQVDQRKHVALILYAADQPIAVCHVIRYDHDWHTVDVGVSVVEQWQGRGAGGLLLRQALEQAGDVHRIDTQVLLGNVAAVRMLQSVGTLTLDCTQGHCRAVVDVRGDRGRHQAA